MLFSFITFIILVIGLGPHYINATMIARFGAIVLICSSFLTISNSSFDTESLLLFNSLFKLSGVVNVVGAFRMILGSIILLNINNVKGFLSHRRWEGESYVLFGVSSIIGAIFIISSNDLISLFLAIELQSFAIYLIAASDTRSITASSAALKYFLLGALSTGLILIGSVSQYYYSGTTSLEFVSSKDVWSNISRILILSGLLFKIAAVPFHSWAPDVYDGVSAQVAAWLQALPKISVVVFLIHFNNTEIFIISAIASLIVGTVLGIKQNRIRKLLAYSTVSHVGFILITLFCYNINSNSVTILYLIAYSRTTIALLLSVSLVGVTTGTEAPEAGGWIKDLSGLGKTNPCLAISFAIGLLSLAGIPPLFGFFAKANVLLVTINEGLWPIAFVAILCSVISAWYYLSLIAQRFFSDQNKESISYNNSYTITAYTISVVVIALVTYPIWNELILNICALATLNFSLLNTIFTSFGFLVVLVGALFLLNSILSVSRPNIEKVSPYECGFTALEQTRSPFNIMFYLVGVLFLLLDLEIALLFPVITSLGLEGAHLYGFVVIMIFLILLTVGFVFEFGKGALHISEQRASLNRSTLLP